MNKNQLLLPCNMNTNMFLPRVLTVREEIIQLLLRHMNQESENRRKRIVVDEGHTLFS